MNGWEEDFDAHVREAMREGMREQAPDAERLKRRVRLRIAWERWIRRAVFLAAMVLAMLVGYKTLAPASFGRLYADAARDHFREVVEQRQHRWKEDGKEMAELAAGYGVSGAAAAAFAPSGYKLQYAKTCRLDGTPVLHLVYTNGAKPFSVYLRPRGRGALAKGKVVQEAGLPQEKLTAFQTARFDALVVTEGADRECLAIARRVAEAL